MLAVVGAELSQPVTVSQTIAVEHIRIETKKPFLEVKAALEALLPPLNSNFQTRLQQGDTAGAASELEGLPELSMFLTRDHGGLLRIAGQVRSALQYEIGNPLTASRMTRHNLGAALYAPLRVALYELQDGTTVFEYDLPSSLFGQFGDEQVTEVGRELDQELETVLLRAVA
jgi:uncharacterized protein (DUF302 family)